MRIYPRIQTRRLETGRELKKRFLLTKNEETHTTSTTCNVLLLSTTLDYTSLYAVLRPSQTRSTSCTESVRLFVMSSSMSPSFSSEEKLLEKSSPASSIDEIIERTRKNKERREQLRGKGSSIIQASLEKGKGSYSSCIPSTRKR